MKRSVCVVAVLLMATACGGPAEGEVVAKTIVPPHSWIYMQPIISCSGKGICTTTYVPITKHDPECAQLTLRGKGGDEEKVCVGRVQYDLVSIGQWYREAKS